MARNRKIKYLWKPRKLWKCRTKGTRIRTQHGSGGSTPPTASDSYASNPTPAADVTPSSAAESPCDPPNPNPPTPSPCPTPVHLITGSPALIPSHLSEDDQARRRACERRIVDIIESRLIREGPEMELGDLVKIQKMLCELKKLDIAADNHQLARAAVQADQDERAAQRAEQNQPELSREQKADALRQIANDIYGLDLDAAPPRNPPAPPTAQAAPAMHPSDAKSPDHQIDTSPSQTEAESKWRLARDKTRPVVEALIPNDLRTNVL